MWLKVPAKLLALAVVALESKPMRMQKVEELSACVNFFKGECNDN